MRLPTYGDIAVLTRTRDFGRELLSTADAYEFPMAYGGGIELFRTDQAKLLLAWLRILEDGSDAERGWAVVLERAGYTPDEIEYVLKHDAYPDEMNAFRTELSELETHTAVARRVFDRYGYDGATADVVLTTVQSIHGSTTMTRGDLIRIIERGIEDGYTEEVQAAAGTDSVTVQTIHSVKGLEYPIVILGNMNSGKFPPDGGSAGAITYSETTGLRQRKCYAEAYGDPHVYDNWRADILRKCQPNEHDEERRLLYVAMTRAETHLLFAGGDEPNTFLEELPVDVDSLEPAISSVDVDEESYTQLDIAVPDPAGPEKYSPHSLMDDSLFEDVSGGRGMDFGLQVHEFAENYVLGKDVTPESDNEEHIEAFLDSLTGEPRVEERAYLPLEVDGEQVTLSGIIDLVHVTDDGVEILDFKNS